MAANYDLVGDMEKRVRFFDGQFLQDQDFIDEQKYHLDRVRRHQRLLHVAGIADGLAVAPAGANKVSVAPGTAVDADGRQLVLAQQATVDLPAETFNNQRGVRIAIAYRETPADRQAREGSADDTRWLERPEIVRLAANEAWKGNTPPVVLAEVALDNQGTVTVNPGVRQYAGVRLPGPAADAPALRATAAGPVGLTGSLSVSAGGSHLLLRRETTETTGGKQRFLELLQDDQSPAKVPEVWPGIRFHHAYRFWHRLEAQPNGFHFKEGNFAGDGYVPVRTGDLTVTGNVGIGTTAPGSDLEIGNFDARNRYLTLKVAGGNQYRSGVKLWAWKENYGYSIEYDERVATGNGLHVRTHNQTVDGTTRLFVGQGGNVGVGTTAPDGKLTVSAGGSHLLLRREATETTGGKQMFLELYQLDGSPAKVPEVWPGIRFHHAYRFWHRLEAQPNGFHFKDGNFAGDGYVPVRTGNLTVEGDLTVAAAKTISSAGRLHISGDELLYLLNKKGVVVGKEWGGTGDLVVQGTLQALGNVGKLSVSAGGSHLLLRREATETTGGKQMFLELYQHDGSPAKVPEVWPGIRFHHAYRFWHRLEAQPNGFHFKDGNFAGDGYVPVRTGNLTVEGDLTVAAAKTISSAGRLHISGDELLYLLNKDGVVVGKEWGGNGNLSVQGALGVQGELTVQSALRAKGDVWCGASLYFHPGWEWGYEDQFGVREQRYWYIFRGRWNINNFAPGGIEVRATSTKWPSDLRLKDHVRTIPDPLEKVGRLRGVQFSWNELGMDYLTRDIEQTVTAGPDATEQENRRLWSRLRERGRAWLGGANIGLIAQDVEAVMPELVETDGEGFKRVDYNRLSAVLVEAVKEQQALIRGLGARLAALEQGGAR